MAKERHNPQLPVNISKVLVAEAETSPLPKARKEGRKERLEGSEKSRPVYI